MWFYLYIIVCLFLGAVGRHRVMGFWGYFFASVVLTPLIGLLLVVVSQKIGPTTG